MTTTTTAPANCSLYCRTCPGSDIPVGTEVVQLGNGTVAHASCVEAERIRNLPRAPKRSIAVSEGREVNGYMVDGGEDN